jgi:hypothetical protein
LDEVWKGLDKTEHCPGDLNLKELLDQVEDYRIQRLFDTKLNLILVFWYIAFVGYIGFVAVIFSGGIYQLV